MKLKPTRILLKDKPKYVEALDAVYTAVAELKTREDVKHFLKDILTESERVMVGRRILIAQRLLRDISYEQIVAELKVGMDTITRVHQWLLDEDQGLEKAIRKLEGKLLDRKKIKDETGYTPLSFKSLKQRYPLHFLLFNIFDKLK